MAAVPAPPLGSQQGHLASALPLAATTVEPGPGVRVRQCTT